MQPYTDWLNDKKQGLAFRQLASCPPGLLDFSHNDYLGLSQHPQLIEAAVKATRDFGTSVASSPLVCGHTPLAQQLTQAVADWTQTPHALLFGSGYQLNQTVLYALGQLPDVQFLLDKACHASLVDGMLASGARWQRFRHNDMAHLQVLLQRARARHAHAPLWVVTESVFSMQGDLCPLTELAALCQQFDAQLYLDEAHACGLYGEERAGQERAGQSRFSGLAEATQTTVTLRMGTFSKALGSYGAWLVTPYADLSDYLVNASRGLIYSTGLPPATLAASLAALQVVQTETQPRQQLKAFILQARDTQGALHPSDSQCGSPIMPVPMPDNATCLALAQALAGQGYWVKAIRPPTVVTPQLRLTLSARYNANDLNKLIKIIKKDLLNLKQVKTIDRE